MRSTQPTSSPHTPSSPVSSRSSRTTASATSSPRSTRPPGTDHSPAAGPWPRRISSRLAVVDGDGAHAQLGPGGHGASVRAERTVHHDGPGLEAEGLEEVLGVAVAGQGDGVDADATPLGAPGHQQVHHGLAHADAAGLGLDEQLVHHPQRPSIGQPHDPDGAVADGDVVDRAHDDALIGVDQGAAAGSRPAGSWRPSVSDHSSPPRRGRWRSMARRASRSRSARSSTSARRAASITPISAGRSCSGSSCGPARPPRSAARRRARRAVRPPSRGTTCDADRLS